MLSAYARITSLLLVGMGLTAQTNPQAELDAAYKALTTKDYDSAVAHFRAGLSAEPQNAAARKDFAYTLLKVGENTAARDQFRAALELNRHDDPAALEFAFLAYETGQPIEARRTFDRLRKQGSAATRVTAEQAFQNIDKPLAEGIARWKEALARSAKPNDLAMFSAHWELAHLAELRDELPLASEQYEICRHLKPQLGEVLLILARIWQQLNRVEDAKAAILAASRAQNPRTAEQGLELWGNRYPYPYEFVNAIALEPGNTNLRRELGFLYLAMDKRPDAIEQFRQILNLDPKDELVRKQLDSLQHSKAEAVHPAPVTPSAEPSLDAKAMGLKSLSLGYARDAIRYLSQAHDANPDDFEVMLRLGYAYNYAHDDSTAMQWFNRARRSPDRKISAEAQRAYTNLSGGTAIRTTTWMLPMYSSRWNDVFSYAQWKRTLPLPEHWFSLYVSARFVGDLTSSLPRGSGTPLYLSDSAVIAGIGISSKTWHHMTSWAEAGESMKYLPFRRDVGNAVPDYRGGVSFAKGFGHLLGGPAAGPFFETTADAVFISRYDKDWIFSSQNRTGWSFRTTEGTSAQVLWNLIGTHDLKNQYWAETVETGPGVKLRFSWMHPGVYFSTDFLHGVYTNNENNPRRPNYNDVRVGFWYAFSK
jgi:tetratricopeptide (TPR) repeat protein